MYKKSHHLSPLPLNTVFPPHSSFLDIDIVPAKYILNVKDAKFATHHPSEPRLQALPTSISKRNNNNLSLNRTHNISTCPKRVQTIRLKKTKKTEDERKNRLLFKFIQYTTSQVKENVRNNRHRRLSFAPTEKQISVYNLNYSNPKTESGPSSSDQNSGNERGDSNGPNAYTGLHNKGEGNYNELKRVITKKALKKKMEYATLDCKEDSVEKYELRSKRVEFAQKPKRKIIRYRNKSAVTSLVSIQKKGSFLIDDDENKEFVDEKACNIIKVVVTKAHKQ
jgi:hypothetical protein